jgi:hypothetical protein
VSQAFFFEPFQHPNMALKMEQLEIMPPALKDTLFKL